MVLDTRFGRVWATRLALLVAAVAVRLGGLTVLVIALLPRGELDALRAVVPRFSRIAFAAVVVILATGTLQGWSSVGRYLMIEDGRIAGEVLDEFRAKGHSGRGVLGRAQIRRGL